MPESDSEPDLNLIKSLYDRGEQYSIATTISSDFIPWKGSGSFVYGTLANSGISGRFLDLSSHYGCLPLGYDNPQVKQAISKQLNTGLFHFAANDWHSRQPVLLKEKLIEITPIEGEKKVFLCNSGTEAVEAALKFCQARRAKELGIGAHYPHFSFFASQRGFHGRTLGALSLSSSKKIHRDGFSTPNSVCFLPFPEKNNQNAIDAFNERIDYISPGFLRNTNALFLELVQGEGGINVIDPTSLYKIVDICRKNDIYIIADEVQTGLMRTGKMFACDNYGLKPDIVCMAKALGGGLPLGAVVCKAEFQLEPGQHSSTFGGNPICCSAGLATIAQLEQLDTHELTKKINILAEFAHKGLGMMRRIVFENKEKRDWVTNEALRQKVIVIPAGEKAIRLMPPLNIKEEDLINGISTLKEIINKIPA